MDLNNTKELTSKLVKNYISQFCFSVLYLVHANRLEARCAYGKFDCADRNPCTPTLCEAGVENYPGSSPRRYVNCTEGCTESLCPRRQVWDQEKQRCVKKPM